MSSQPVAAEPGLPPPPGAARPADVLRHPAWVAAEAALLAAARDALAQGGAGVVALLGGPGVGKTLMLEALERRLRAEGIAAQRLDFGDLAQGAETAPVLLVDEADRIDDAALAALAAGTASVAVLAALPGFAARLEGLAHRVVRLRGLRAEDVAGYVAARLAALDVPPGRIGPDALAALGLESAGVPRLLNVLIGSSLFTAGLEKAAAVTGEHVRSAAGMHALSAVRVRVTQVPRDRHPVAPAVAERDVEPEPPVAMAAAGSAPPQAGARVSRGILPWLAAGVVLGLFGAAAAWMMLGPASGSAVRRETAVLPEVRAAAPRPGDELVPPRVGESAPLRVGELAPLRVDELARVAESVPPRDEPAPQVVPALPVAPPARIVLTYPRGDAAATARGEALAAALRAAGRNVAAPFPVSQATGEEVLRYFFLEDREMARSVGVRAGQAPQTHRLGAVPDGAPLPRPGTVEWALPGAGGARLVREAPMPERAALMAPEAMAPGPGAVLPARLPLEVELRWRMPAATTASPCCFVEVMRLEEGAWQEVFSGYAPLPDRHAVPLTAARGYAWRVTLVSRDGPRYAAGRWSRFTVQEGGE